MLAIRGAYQALDTQLAEQVAALKVQREASEAKGRELERKGAALDAKQTQLEEREAELQCREERLEEQIRPLRERSSDVLHLNIAGERQQSVRRSTLCQVPGSMLATQFSGRWDEGGKDQDGRLFINFPPDIFLPLLDFLREKEIDMADRRNPLAAPAVSDEKSSDFLHMTEFLGIPRSLLFAPLFFKMVVREGGDSCIALDAQRLHVDVNSFWRATILLESSFEIPSYEVVVEHVEYPEIGWAIVDLPADVQAEKGVGDDFNFWGLDGESGFLHGGHGEDEPTECRWQDNDVVRCTLDRKVGLMRFFVNDVEAVDCRRPLPEEKLSPAIMGIGKWSFRLPECLGGRPLRIQAP